MKSEAKGEIGFRLREARRARRLTMREVAEAIKISAGHYANVESGTANIGLAALTLAAEKLRVRIQWLLDGQDPMELREVDRVIAMQERTRFLYEDAPEHVRMVLRESGGPVVARSLDLITEKAQTMRAAYDAGVATWEDLYRNIGRQLDEIERNNKVGS
jgi:transcriptional regulator with XRE-family HTH domain